MDARRFLAEFEHIAAAPQGVKRLRELILSLAFKGDLCPNSADSADELLRSIELQREQLKIETQAQRFARQSFEPHSSDGPYSIPENWRWVTLSTVGHTWGQKKPESTFVYIDVSSIDNKAGALSESLETLNSVSAPSRARKIVRKGTIIYSTVRPYLLNIAIIDRDFDYEPIASTAFAVVHPWEGVDHRYLYYYLRSPWFVTYVESVQIGIAYPAISDEKFYSGLVPLPSTEEQSRIVAKVDELMAFCDELEKQQEDRRKLRNAVRTGILRSIATAISPHELQTAWARFAENFGRLFSSPEDVGELRDLILDLACGGLLSEPTSSDSDPNNLLEEIKAHQRSKFSAREIRELSVLPEASRDGRRIRSPLGHLVKLISGQHLSPNEYNERGEGVPYITGPAEFKGETPNPTKWTTERRSIAGSGDILITVKGSGVGKTARCDLEELAISRQLMAIRPLGEVVADYLALCISAAERVFQKQKFGIAIPGIGRDEVLNLQVLVPSKEEQQRIVDRVAELRSLCDLLEVQLLQCNRVVEQFATASVFNLIGIRIVQQKGEAVKAPQSELIAPLRLSQFPDIKAQAPLATLLARHDGEMSARDLWQRFGGEIDAFYAQLKAEVAHGWIAEPSVAEMREKFTDVATA